MPTAARKALHQVRQRKRRKHKPAFERRFYLCPDCGKFHLTKMTSKSEKSIDHRREDHE